MLEQKEKEKEKEESVVGVKTMRNAMGLAKAKGFAIPKDMASHRDLLKSTGSGKLADSVETG